MAVFLIRSLFRQSSATAIFGRQLRSTWSVSAAKSDYDGSEVEFNEKKVRVKATFVLEGHDASDVKALIEVLGRQLKVAEVMKAAAEHMKSDPAKAIRASCYPKVSLKGVGGDRDQQLLLSAAQTYAKCFSIGAFVPENAPECEEFDGGSRIRYSI